MSNLTADNLLNILKFTNGFVSGGFALNVFQIFNNAKKSEALYTVIDKLLNSTSVSYSDIDLFVRIPYTKSESACPPFKSNFYPFEKLAKLYIKSVLSSNNYVMNNNEKICRDRHVKRRLHIDVDGPEYFDSALSHYIKNIETYSGCENPNKKFQLITLFDCSIEDFMETFDINICRVALIANNGKFAFYHDVTHYLSQSNLQMILNKQMYVHCPLYPPNLKKRIIKYIDRGYTLITKSGEEVFSENIDEYILQNYNFNYVTYEQFAEYKKTGVFVCTK